MRLNRGENWGPRSNRFVSGGLKTRIEEEGNVNLVGRRQGKMRAGWSWQSEHCPRYVMDPPSQWWWWWEG